MTKLSKLNNFKNIALICLGAVFYHLCLLILIYIKSDKLICDVISIHDGDTITVNIPGFPDIVGKKIEVRFNGIDTPEMNDNRPKIKRKAISAREFVVNKIKNNKVELRNLKRDKYFRLDADVFVNGENLNKELLKANLAKKYDGKTKEKWE